MKQLFFGSCLLLLAGTSNIQAQSIKVATPSSCKVALISIAEAGSADGWWDVWHQRKSSNKNYFSTPYTFKKMAPGEYVLVVFDEGASNASAESDGVVIEAIKVDKKTKLSYNFKIEDFVEWNCLSCPWLYAFDGNKYQKLEEVIQDVVGKESCKTTAHTISSAFVVDGKLKLRIQEEKDETSFLDKITLTINGKVVTGKVAASLEKQDESYLELKKGDAVDLEFDLSGIDLKDSKIVLDCTGFYEPDRAYLQAIYQKYLYKHN